MIKDRKSLYTLEGNPGLLLALPYSVQQVLTMFISNLVPIGLVAAAASPKLSAQEIMMLVQSCMIAAGVATFIQVTPIWKIGSGLPIFMGVSFTFVVPLTAFAARYGYGSVVGAVMVGGLFETVLGLTVKYWRRVVAPIVSAVVVTGIGLSLLSTATRSFGGGYADDFGAMHNILIGVVTMAVSLGWMALTQGKKRRLAILIGMVAGYILALCMGKVDVSSITEAGWLALPRILYFKPVFRIETIVSIFIIYIISATETLGDAAAIASSALDRKLTDKEAAGVLTADGFGSFLSSLFGGLAVTSYSENIGLTIVTGVVNRNVVRVGAVLLILAGLIPPVGRIFATVPEPIIGALLLIVMGEIIVSGIEMISKAGFTARNKIIVAISLSVAIGFTATTETGIWNNFPLGIQIMFSQNVVAVIFILALLLNLVLPKDMEDPPNE